MHFFSVFFCVCDYDGFAFIGSGYHGVFLCKFSAYAFYDVCLSFLFPSFLVVRVEDLFEFFGCEYAEWIL